MLKVLKIQGNLLISNVSDYDLVNIIIYSSGLKNRKEIILDLGSQEVVTFADVFTYQEENQLMVFYQIVKNGEESEIKKEIIKL